MVSEAKPSNGFNWFGVPYNSIDVNCAIDHLKKFYNTENDMALAVERLLDNNERVVSRCSMLMTFSSLTMAVFFFIANSIANNKAIQLAMWQRCGIYIATIIWIPPILCLLWSLKHELPPPEKYTLVDDFEFTAKLFFKRMGLYNVALFVSIISFIIMIITLLPIDFVINDHFFK